MGSTHNSGHCVVLKVELAKYQPDTKRSNKNIQNNASTHLCNKTLLYLHTQTFNHLLVFKGILNAILKNTSSSQNTFFQIPHFW